MREIILSTGNTATVDDCDYMFLFLYKWYEVQQGNKKIAVRRTDEGKVISMHKHIMGDGKWSHKDGNGLNNSRSNITEYQVSRINGYAKNYSNEFKGVTKKSHGRYMAQICYNGKVIYLCSCKSKQRCVIAYDAAVQMVRTGGYINLEGFNSYLERDIRDRIKDKLEGIRLSKRNKMQFQAA